ncbi:biotin/lipoate A/B protein ligase [Isosphaera pallida ATCC 43644]|uniref:lipoyl(octanoyl) transferase n=1 Tax=Isosphaera pallida (strain ATCC 43644 / DSM 9630 / IS1B) TaxID=575540 RepID=E8QX98_ISOPI|nr:lipoyl(octanoyl) transferase LipB [Isosphaera pallida]ADV61939.1 biotin/lipoate A/B protein ligase [Isosphaera pallida ATCC 43644]
MARGTFRPTGSLRVYLLGTLPQEAASRLQRRLIYDMGESDGVALVVCEHPTVATVGRLGSRRHLVPDDVELSRLGIRVVWVNRGGGVILHGPGQLVGYVIGRLDAVGLNLQGWLDALHDAVVATLSEFDLPARLRDDAPGIFLDHARVATVAVGVSRGVAHHGLTINLGNDLGLIHAVLNEPGPRNRPLRQTSMESRRGRPTPSPAVREALARHLESRLGLTRRQVFTTHSFLGREVRLYESRGFSQPV